MCLDENRKSQKKLFDLWKWRKNLLSPSSRANRGLDITTYERELSVYKKNLSYIPKLVCNDDTEKNSHRTNRRTFGKIMEQRYAYKSVWCRRTNKIQIYWIVSDVISSLKSLKILT